MGIIWWILGGVFHGAFGGTPHDGYSKEKVLESLAKLAGHKVAKNLTQCDLNGSILQKDGTEIDRAVHVRDMFVKHVLWSYRESEFKVQGFDCEVDADQNKSKVQDLSCRWWFGEKEAMPKSPGWSISLVFPYNPRTHEIKAAKIQCIKVP